LQGLQTKNPFSKEMGTPEGWRMVPQRQKALAQLRHRQCFLQDVVDGNSGANHLLSMIFFLPYQLVIAGGPRTINSR